MNSKAYWQWLLQCNHYHRQDYVPLVIAEQSVGYIHQNHLPLFTQQQSLFQQQTDRLLVSAELNSVKQRSERINAAVFNWYQQGILSHWCDEAYRVAVDLQSPCLMVLDRAAASFFGILKYGVHVNAIVYQADGLYMWIAKRALDKSSFPGKLDHLVAGGHAYGLTIQQTLIKECAEEANIPSQLAQQAKPVGLVSYVMEQQQTLVRDCLLVYDLLLPNDFQPVNTDGEVDEFYLLPIEEVMALVAKTQQFKTNCNLVLIDFFIRYGYISADTDYYIEIVQQLKNRL